MQLTDEQRLDWLRLIRSPKCRPRTFRALVNHFGGARAALEALPSLARRGGASPPRRYNARLMLSAKWRPRKSSASHFVALGEGAYPPRLQMIDDAPPLLRSAATCEPSRCHGGDRRLPQRLGRGIEIHPADRA